MIRLDNNYSVIKIELSGSVTTSQLPVIVSYSDKSNVAYTGSSEETLTDDTTAVIICESPKNDEIRDIDTIQVINEDTAPAQVRIFKDTGTETTIYTVLLSIGDQLTYTHSDGWKVIDLNGVIKTGLAGPPGPPVAFPLTIGFGLTGGSYDGSAPITIDVDTGVVLTLTGAQAVSNKTGLISQWTNDVGYLIGSASALTKVDDTNVTLTLGGTPATALLQGVSLTLGWTGILGITRGGTGLGSLGTALQEIRVNALGTALEYYTPGAVGSQDLEDVLTIGNITGYNDIILSNDISGTGYSQLIKSAGGNTYIQFKDSGQSQIYLTAVDDVILGTATLSLRVRESLSRVEIDNGTLRITPFAGNKALISNVNKELSESATTDTELGYVSGVTSSIQAQLNALGSGTVTNVSSANADITVATATTTPVLTLVQSPALRSATTTINVSSATAPTIGQVLTATSGTAATWQTPSGGGSQDLEDVLTIDNVTGANDIILSNIGAGSYTQKLTTINGLAFVQLYDATSYGWMELYGDRKITLTTGSPNTTYIEINEIGDTINLQVSDGAFDYKGIVITPTELKLDNIVTSADPNDQVAVINLTGVIGKRTIASIRGTQVTSVSGTTNRITSTGGTTPIIDIDAAYDALWQPTDADLTAIAALGFTSTSFLKKTGVGTWALDTNTYLSAIPSLANVLATDNFSDGRDIILGSFGVSGYGDFIRSENSLATLQFYDDNATNGWIEMHAKSIIWFGTDTGNNSFMSFNGDYFQVVSNDGVGTTSISLDGVDMAFNGLSTSVSVNDKMLVVDNVSGKVGYRVLPSGGGITRSVIVPVANTTMAATALTDYVYLVGGAYTMTLPTAVGNTNLYTVKNNHSVNITVNTTSSQTMDGSTTVSLTPNTSLTFISNNSNWSII